MQIAIHPDKIASESYSEKWAGLLQKRNIKVKWVDLTTIDVLKQVKDCDGVMWRWAHIPRDKIKALRILYTIEHYLGIPVFPNHSTCWHYDDKLAQYYMLQAVNAPMPKTWVFWDKEEALNWAEKAIYPKVFKLSSGASSSNVIKVSTNNEAYKLINRMFDHGVFPMSIKRGDFSGVRKKLSHIKRGLIYAFTGTYPPLPWQWWQPEKNYAYFQEFVPNNPYDTRISVIGDRAFGYRRFNRPNDFRASGSGNFDIEPAKIDLNCIKIAVNISKKLKFQSMAYDFLLKDEQYLITEVSYTFVDWMVQKCPGYWNSDLKWVEGNMWPEKAQIEDFIDYIKKNNGLSGLN